MAAIEFKNCTGGGVKDTIFSDISGPAVTIEGCRNMSLAGTKSRNCKTLLKAENSTNITVSDGDHSERPLTPNDVPSYSAQTVITLPDSSDIDFPEHNGVGSVLDNEIAEQFHRVDDGVAEFQIQEIKPNRAQQTGDFIGSLLGSASKSFFS